MALVHAAVADPVLRSPSATGLAMTIFRAWHSARAFARQLEFSPDPENFRALPGGQ